MAISRGMNVGTPSLCFFTPCPKSEITGGRARTDWPVTVDHLLHRLAWNLDGGLFLEIIVLVCHGMSPCECETIKPRLTTVVK